MATVKILMSCPNCGETNWYTRKDGFECASCGEFYDTDDMCSTTKPVKTKYIPNSNISELAKFDFDKIIKFQTDHNIETEILGKLSLGEKLNFVFWLNDRGSLEKNECLCNFAWTEEGFPSWDKYQEKDFAIYDSELYDALKYSYNHKTDRYSFVKFKKKFIELAKRRIANEFWFIQEHINKIRKEHSNNSKS